MKRITVLTMAAFTLAVGSAFITKPKSALGDYHSTKVTNGVCNTMASGNRSDCKGTGSICTVDNVTYYSNGSCGTELKFPD